MRLVDLHCNWALQYAGETTQYDPALYADYPRRVAQVDGYLTGVSAAVLACGRRPEDWAQQAAPWDTLVEMIARYEAEFPGRLLLGPADVERWMVEPDDAMCWGVLAIEGLDSLVRGAPDLERMAGLFRRGVRVFQLVESGNILLGGSDVPGDDRGLTDLGRATLDQLDCLATQGAGTGALPALDIADLNDRSTSDVLSWFEAEPGRSERLLLVRSHGGIRTTLNGNARGLGPENLRRFRALEGTLGMSVGPPHVDSPEALHAEIDSVAAMPLGTEPGYEGIAIGTDFLQLERSLDPLKDASGVIDWLGRTFPAPVAEAIAHRTARSLLLRLSGSSRAIGQPLGQVRPRE